MPKKLKTNTDLVVNLMEYSPRGALAQAFIVTAIEKYAAAVAKQGAATFDSPMLNGEAWVAIAKDTQARIDAFYGRHTAQTEPGVTS